jgi:hypothetical protein
VRPLLALAILLLGIQSAVPEGKNQDLPTGGANQNLNLISPTSESSAAVARSERMFAVATPMVESSDAAHDQDEEAAAPPPSPAPVSTDADANADIAGSMHALCNTLLTSAQDNDLPVAFFANLLWQESRLQHDAVSRVGALGIAQFMPQVAVEVGLGDPFDPRQAIPASARLLHALREHFGNLGFAAAAYNAGAKRVGEWLDRRRSLPRETKVYVLRVTGHSIEAWRKSPVDDAKLTFVQRLPCRALPTFADLEQAQLREPEHADDAPQQSQAQPLREKAKTRLAAKAKKIIRKVAPTPEPKAAVIRRRVAVRKAARKMAGERGRVHRAHVGHERHRIA